MDKDGMPCPRREEAPFAITPPEEDHWREDGTCSYCGSGKPIALLADIEEGLELTPTDKNYKVYCRASKRGGPAGKFYFQHFGEVDKAKLIQLLNERKIKFAEPGYFYVLPFFISR